METVPAEEVRIVVRRNGPYRLYGLATIVDAEGNEYARPEGEWVHLCRCGRSGTKPYCDGTHKHVGFVAESAVPPHSQTD
ncbi:MAG: CDGSH iron-sulfur domain-containing protein [Chloroflexota bacterium]